jgi:hypothetical protein
MPETTSASRPAVPVLPDEESTHFHIRPAIRPKHIPEPTDYALFAIGDQAGRLLAGRLRRLGQDPQHIEPLQAAAILATFGDDLAHLLTDHADAADRITTGQPAATIHAWNRWLDGLLGDGPALIDLAWRLGCHPATVGALETLLSRINI